MKMPLQRRGVSRSCGTKGHAAEIGMLPMSSNLLLNIPNPLKGGSLGNEIKSLRLCEVTCGRISAPEAKNMCLTICRNMGNWAEGF